MTATAIRDRIRTTLRTLKAEGISQSELIECMGNELHLLKLQDQKESETRMDGETEWNPDTAGKEMAALFDQADSIFQQPHYQQVEGSGDELHTRTADSLPNPEQTND